MNNTPSQNELDMVADLDAEAKEWPLVRDSNGILRFKADESASRSELWDMWQKLRRNEITDCDLLKYYRQIGYELGAYLEIYASLKE